MRRMITLTLMLGAGLVGWSQTAEAGRMPNPGVDTDLVRPHGTVTYSNEWFYSGELAEVTVAGDGSTLLTVTVEDEFGHEVASDYGYTCRVTWYPRWTGRFTIQVHNLGYQSNYYEMTTN